MKNVINLSSAEIARGRLSTTFFVFQGNGGQLLWLPVLLSSTPIPFWKDISSKSKRLKDSSLDIVSVVSILNPSPAEPGHALPLQTV